MRADRGGTLLVTVVLLTLIALCTSALAHLGGVLIDHARVRTAADAAALAAVVWQVPDPQAPSVELAALRDLIARHGAELVHLDLRPPVEESVEELGDALVGLEVGAVEVTVRRGAARATARAMARETPLPTMAP